MTITRVYLIGKDSPKEDKLLFCKTKRDITKSKYIEKMTNIKSVCLLMDSYPSDILLNQTLHTIHTLFNHEILTLSAEL